MPIKLPIPEHLFDLPSLFEDYFGYLPREAINVLQIEPEFDGDVL